METLGRPLYHFSQTIITEYLKLEREALTRTKESFDASSDIHLSRQCLLFTAWYVPGSVLSAEDTTVIKALSLFLRCQKFNQEERQAHGFQR